MLRTRNMEELYKVYESKMQDYIINEDISNISDEIVSKTDDINNQLSDEQQLLLQEILELEHERLSLEEQEVFTYGFVLGIKLYREIEMLVTEI